MRFHFTNGSTTYKVFLQHGTEAVTSLPLTPMAYSWYLDLLTLLVAKGTSKAGFFSKKVEGLTKNCMKSEGMTGNCSVEGG